MRRAALPLWLLLALLAGRWAAASDAEVRMHLGRPTVFVDGRPTALPAYSPVGRSPELSRRNVSRFLPHRMGAYHLTVSGVDGRGFYDTAFWAGDTISAEPLVAPAHPLDEQVEFILKGDPDARFFIRFFAHEPSDWAALHPDELVVTETGARMPVPSLASERFWDQSARFSAAVVRHCESRPWADRILGYASFLRIEGGHEPAIFHWQYDHGPAMTARWRGSLKQKYGTEEALRAAHGSAALTFDNAPVPSDPLRGTVEQVSSLLYWQPAAANQPMRDYLLLQADLFASGLRGIARASVGAADHKRIFVYDALKQTMLGWSNPGFFDLTYSWRLAYPEMAAGSGQTGAAALFDAPGFDGLITPYDYQARGMGGVMEPEGSADSTVLRGKLFLCEMDARTRYEHTEQDYGAARNLDEFAAITWRNVAASLTRGFQFYWMDLAGDWFAEPAMHEVIARQVQVVRDSLQWPHADVPGIAMVLDDAAVLETNGAGNYFNEAVMWEQKMGLARCGVPFRIYLLEDLRLENFPRHRVFYFPNLFRVDDERLALLRKVVFRDGNVVLWGPGSGISDGRTIGPDGALRLTGFQFEFLPVNYQRRVLITDFDHPITRGLEADTVIGGPLAYGPILFPKDGRPLGMAWTKQGRNYCGLAVKAFGRAGQAGAPLGPGDWHSVFTTAVPIPADMWRGLARLAGAHVWCESNDVLLADSSVVALHSMRTGEKRIALPGRLRVEDLIAGTPAASGPVSEIRFRLDAPGTRVYHLMPQ